MSKERKVSTVWKCDRESCDVEHVAKVSEADERSIEHLPHGWSRLNYSAALPKRGVDLCPACTRRAVTP